MVARELLRILALVSLIVASAAVAIALTVLGAMVIDVVAGWLRHADERVIGGIAAAGICLAILAGQGLRETK